MGQKGGSAARAKDTRMRLPKILTVLAAVSLIAAGCGDDEGGGEALSKDEFVKQANDVCKKYEAKAKELGDPQSLEELPEYADKAVALFDDQLGELKDLTPPEDMQEDYDALIATGEDAKKTIQDLKSAAQDKDEQEIQKISQDAEKRDQESDKLAADLGLTECSKG